MFLGAVPWFLHEVSDIIFNSSIITRFLVLSSLQVVTMHRNRTIYCDFCSLRESEHLLWFLQLIGIKVLVMFVAVYFKQSIFYVCCNLLESGHLLWLLQLYLSQLLLWLLQVIEIITCFMGVAVHWNRSIYNGCCIYSVWYNCTGIRAFEDC